jgi:hypothetical protein
MSSIGSVSPIPEFGGTQTKSRHAPSTSKIGGVDIEINETSADAKVLTPLYKKEDRMNLSDDKRNGLFDRATKNGHSWLMWRGAGVFLGCGYFLGFNASCILYIF